MRSTRPLWAVAAMTRPAKPDWAALRRLWADMPSADAPSRAQPPPDDPDTARDVAEERAAILEFEAGLDRAEAERIAFQGLDRKTKTTTETKARKGT